MNTMSMWYLGATDTQTESRYDGRRSGAKPLPGLVIVFCGQTPMLRVLPLAAGAVVLGRDNAGGAPLEDDRFSQEHLRVERTADGWGIEDLGSRNGTYVDGLKIAGRVIRHEVRALRAGRTLMFPISDLRPFEAGMSSVEKDRVVGPRLSAVLQRVAAAAAAGENVLITGESGSGKELAARVFHEAAARGGPFVAVNCATIPHALAEATLFGALKGAHSEAKTHREGYVQAADGGVLFLDELGELDLPVQAKLLRLIETSEVFALGASQPHKVRVRFCAATNRDLRAAIDQGTFRGDLYFRLAQPEIRLPPLRERLEELPWHVAQVVREHPAGLEPHVSLVEACMLRRWGGNLRELFTELREAARAAAAAGSGAVRAEHLPASIGAAKPAEALVASRVDPEGLSREQVIAALESSGHRVSRAAKALGLHRNQLYRLLERFDIRWKDESP